MILNRPIESRDIYSSESVLALTSFLESESHIDISTASRSDRIPSSTFLVFISSPLWYSHTLFLCVVWLSVRTGTSGLTTFSCIRYFFMSYPFLNYVLTYRPGLYTAFRYNSGSSLPTANPTPLKNQIWIGEKNKTFYVSGKLIWLFHSFLKLIILCFTHSK